MDFEPPGGGRSGHTHTCTCFEICSVAGSRQSETAKCRQRSNICDFTTFEGFREFLNHRDLKIHRDSTSHQYSFRCLQSITTFNRNSQPNGIRTAARAIGEAKPVEERSKEGVQYSFFS